MRAACETLSEYQNCLGRRDSIDKRKMTLRSKSPFVIRFPIDSQRVSTTAGRVSGNDGRKRSEKKGRGREEREKVCRRKRRRRKSIWSCMCVLGWIELERWGIKERERKERRKKKKKGEQSLLPCRVCRVIRGAAPRWVTRRLPRRQRLAHAHRKHKGGRGSRRVVLASLGQY